MIAIARCFCLLLIAASASLPSRPTLPVPEQTATSLFPEARLRKLHLVRPDLISYPVAFDVVC